MFRDAKPSHWKMCVFYYDPENPRALVSKRSRLGLTVNFARPIIWAVGALFLAASIYFAIANN